MEIEIRAWDGNKMHCPSSFEFGINNWNNLPSISFEHKKGMLTTSYFMLYTGLNDMNEKKIYEEDIIRKEMCSSDDPAYGFYGEEGIVKFKNGAFIVIWESGKEELLCKQIQQNIEVIGNTYEEEAGNIM